MLELLLNPTHVSLPEETVFSTAGVHEMTVPEGATTMSAVAVGGGQSASSSSLQHNGGSGGSLRYRNAIPVTPGEKMTVVVGKGGAGNQTATKSTYAAKNGASSSISRGSTYLLRAAGGGEAATNNTTMTVAPQSNGLVGGLLDLVLADVVGGLLGGLLNLVGGILSGIATNPILKPETKPIIGGGGGGAGGSGSLTTKAVGGGGAGGYMGDGSPGVAYGSTPTSPADTGAGYGGNVTMTTQGTAKTYTGRGGGGIKPTGRKKDIPGSGAGYPTAIAGGGAGGGGASQYKSDGTSLLGSGADGIVRIIWGSGRGYPDDNTAG